MLLRAAYWLVKRTFGSCCKSTYITQLYSIFRINVKKRILARTSVFFKIFYYLLFIFFFFIIPPNDKLTTFTDLRDDRQCFMGCPPSEVCFIRQSATTTPLSAMSNNNNKKNLLQKHHSLPSSILLFLKWLESTQGRDKLLRLVAYASKWIVVTATTAGVDKDIVERIKKGASAIGISRKALRMFKALEYVQEFLKSIDMKDELEKYLSLLKSFVLAVWMMADHIQWFHKVGYLKLKDTKKLDEIHSKAWLYGLFVGAVLAVYKIHNAVNSIAHARTVMQAAKSADNKEHMLTAEARIKDASAKQTKALQSLAKNSIDIIIPAARLGWLLFLMRRLVLPVPSPPFSVSMTPGLVRSRIDSISMFFVGLRCVLLKIAFSTSIKSV